jgi:hypothetical protein
MVLMCKLKRIESIKISMYGSVIHLHFKVNRCGVIPGNSREITPSSSAHDAMRMIAHGGHKRQQ